MNQHPNYELFEELGRGENTVVYRAYDLSLGREVAIKELDENGRRDPRHRERFLREAQFLAQFEHDNVLRVYSVDTDRGWIIMELMKGTLASVIAAGPSDPDLVRSVLKQTLEALAFLHEKNKVHCAVRPSNLLINDAGRVKLSEFEQTAVGGEIRVPTGSKKYLAPELIRPDLGNFGPSLDLYCLAFAALELLKGPQFESLFPGTGKGAIDADTAWLRWHSSPDDLDSVRKLVKGIPDDLARVLDRMLKKRVSDRPQTAQEVLKEIADRPLVLLPLTSTSEEVAPTETRAGFAPAVVKVLSAPQSTASPNKLPSASATIDKPSNTTKKATTNTKRPSERYTKNWFNRQLSRPYILYPLCAVMVLGAVWFSFRVHSAPASVMVAVSFDVLPNGKDVEVLVGGRAIVAEEDGTYRFPPGKYEVSWTKTGFQSATRELNISAENHNFSVKLEPIIKYVDVTLEVVPAEAELRVEGEALTSVQGTYTHRLVEGQPLKFEATLAGYVPVSRTLSPAELSKLGNKVAIKLDREKPRLPKSLIAKPGAKLDPETQLPERVLVSAFGETERLELALVKPGTYSFGYSGEDRMENELSARKVNLTEPFYIAIHETTNAQYQHFVESAGEAQAGSNWKRAAAKWASAYQLDPLKNQLPVTNVSPQQATAFCNWVGGRLPTEVEWECAARGLHDRDSSFPWGKAPLDSTRCQIFNGRLSPVPVDQLTAGANSLGLLNTLGNAAEWCHDSDDSSSFILRGCSFATANINHVRVTWRGKGNIQGEEDTGFRLLVPIANNTLYPTAGTASDSQIGKRGQSSISKSLLSLVPWSTFKNALTSSAAKPPVE